MERVGRVELRDLQLGRLLVAPSPVYPHFNETHYLLCRPLSLTAELCAFQLLLQYASLKCLATYTT